MAAVSPQDLNGGAYSAPQTQSRFSGAALCSSEGEGGNGWEREEREGTMEREGEVSVPQFFFYN